MPETDSDGRQIYGNGGGWNPTMTPAPTEEPSPGAPGASPTPDAAAASSADSVTPETPQTDSSATPDVPFHQHPRWKEIQAEREALRQQNQMLLEIARQQAAQAQPAPAPAPQQDPWEGLVNHPDPATAQFYQHQRRLMQHERQVARQETIQELMPVIDAGRREIARLNSKDFRKENPEIKPGSEEERLVISYMQGQMDGVQHTLESAKRNAMYDKLEAENRALKSKQAAVPQKRAANTEASAGIPATHGLPPPRGDWRAAVGEAVDHGGSLSDVANLLFGGKRRNT